MVAAYLTEHTEITSLFHFVLIFHLEVIVCLCQNAGIFYDSFNMVGTLNEYISGNAASSLIWSKLHTIRGAQLLPEQTIRLRLRDSMSNTFVVMIITCKFQNELFLVNSRAITLL